APRRVLGLVAAAIVLLYAGAAGQLVALAVSALAGAWLLRGRTQPTEAANGEPQGPFSPRHRVSAFAGAAAALLFAGLLLALPLAASLTQERALEVIAAFYRAGALVFGGGHVVLPLLQAGVVGPGWVDEASFLAGYGAAQAVPGPLFTFAAYLGSV